jgi:REP element-mobilizing transposase RayT
MENDLRSRKPLRLRGFDYTGGSQVYFVTICTANRIPYFSDSRLAKITVDEMTFRREKEQINLFCYCIMPDHLHLLLSLASDFQGTLQDWVSAFKRFTARTASELCDVKLLWQKNFYDHVLRNDESLLETAKYIVHNPVRKGMVSNWESYPYSRMMDPFPQ